MSFTGDDDRGVFDPDEEFALRETLEQCSDLTFEVDRVVAHDTAHILPLV